MTIGELLKQVIDWVYAFWPLRIVHEWEQGVRCLFGNTKGCLTSRNGLFKTGLHWFVPAIGSIEVMETNIEVVETDLQTVLSAEDSPVTFSLGVKYRITNLMRTYQEIHDARDTLMNEIASVAGYVASNIEVSTMAEGMCETILHETKGDFEDWGIEVVSLRLMNFSEAQPIRLIMNSREPIGEE
jgi:regulator of protease activity HflC (stomatin/prohibitin superfamily)